MLLKIGDLAKRAGLTVRTLHHYDAIGLLTPSLRSAAGYRLYSREDVARLHAIQTLRHLGLPLAEIASLLEGQRGDPAGIIAQQMRALDQEIARATELRDRLALMRDHLHLGSEPDMREWLDTLSLMSTYSKYFSATELRAILWKWKPMQTQWAQLIKEVRAAMDSGLTPASLALQPLATRWISLMFDWMEGDLELMERWGAMFRQEPSTQGRNNAPQGDMVEFMSQAIKLRTALLCKYLSQEELRGLGRVPLSEWQALQQKASALIEAGKPPGSAPAARVARQWSAMIDRMVNHQPPVRARLLRANDTEPVLQAGLPLSDAVRAYLRQSYAIVTSRSNQAPPGNA